MKKTTLKSILIYICSLAFVFGMGNAFDAFAVSENIYVAQVNSVQYQDYEEAWNAAKGGGTITMLDNWTISDMPDYHNSDGGAIQINNGTVSIARSSYRVSEIAFNNAARNGGAVYVSNGNLLLHENTIIARNNAGKEVGFCYIALNFQLQV